MIVFSILLDANYPELNIRRSYFIETGEDIFGNWIVEINYGRIGCKGRKKVFLMDCEEDAKKEVKKRLKKRERLVKRIGVGYSVKQIYGNDWFESTSQLFNDRQEI
jgi:predicted DNA-binding WGR domain protein